MRLVEAAAEWGIADVEAALARVPEDAPREIRKVVEAAVTSPGKRVRPLVAILAYDSAGGLFRERGVEVGVGVEILHAATLLVDDFVDGAQTRRGRVAPWKRFGHQRALLASGWLVARAFRFAAPSDFDGLEPSPIDDYEAALAAFEDVIGAEARALDGAPVTPPDWVEVARGKTATLFQLAAEGGCRRARNRDLVPAFRAYGTHVGLAFQAADDVLDHVGDAASVGKPTRTDDALAKPNLVTAFGGDVDAARAFARSHAEHAKDALAPVPASAARDALVALADAAWDREA